MGALLHWSCTSEVLAPPYDSPRHRCPTYHQQTTYIHETVLTLEIIIMCISECIVKTTWNVGVVNISRKQFTCVKQVNQPLAN